MITVYETNGGQILITNGVDTFDVTPDGHYFANGSGLDDMLAFAAGETMDWTAEHYDGNIREITGGVWTIAYIEDGDIRILPREMQSAGKAYFGISR